MNDVLASLRSIVDGLPEGGSATLPRHFLEELLATASTTGADLTVAQVAEHFGRSRSTVRSWLEAGVLRGYRLRGREWRVPTAAVAEFREAERQGGVRPNRRGVVDLGAWRREAAS